MWREIIKDLLGTYWTQVLTIGLVAAYFIKRGLDRKSKREEITWTLFQTNRLRCAERFSECFSVCTAKLGGVNFENVLAKHTSSNDYIKVFDPLFKDLIEAKSSFEFYLIDSDKSSLTQIIRDLVGIERNIFHLARKMKYEPEVIVLLAPKEQHKNNVSIADVITIANNLFRNLRAEYGVKDSTIKELLKKTKKG